MQSRYVTYGVILFLFFGFFSCNKTPKGILTEKEMQKVLGDMLIAEAMIADDYNKFPTDSSKIVLYESVFEKHHITRAKYDSSLVWYGKNLDIYMKVLNRVDTELANQIHNIGDVQATAVPSTKGDSVDIWPRFTSTVFYPESPFNGITFDVQPTSNYPSGSSFVLGLRVWGVREELSSYPEIRITAEQRDTTITVEKKIMKDGYFETVVRTLPTRQVRRVYGSIRMNDMDPSYHKIYIDTLSLMRYNYSTNFTVRSDDLSSEEEVNTDVSSIAD